MTRFLALSILTGIAIIGGTVSWLDAGGETRKEWFWCQKMKWCQTKTRQTFMDRELVPPPPMPPYFRPRKKE